VLVSQCFAQEKDDVGSCTNEIVLFITPGNLRCALQDKKILEKFNLIFFFLGFLAKIDVFYRKICENFDLFPQASWQNSVKLFSSWQLLGAEQLICRTPLLAASVYGSTPHVAQ